MEHPSGHMNWRTREAEYRVTCEFDTLEEVAVFMKAIGLVVPPIIEIETRYKTIEVTRELIQQAIPSYLMDLPVRRRLEEENNDGMQGQG